MGRFLPEAAKRPAGIKLRLKIHMLQSSMNDTMGIYKKKANKFYWTLALMSFISKIKEY